MDDHQRNLVAFALSFLIGYFFMRAFIRAVEYEIDTAYVRGLHDGARKTVEVEPRSE